MAKKVLIISSSPRKGGNSDMLCDEFVKGALETGNEVEKIFLKEKAIHPCTGCSVCSMYGKPCPQKDDAAEIVEKKSRFIANLEHVESEEEALAYIETIRKKYWDARHNCYAYCIGKKQELKRCSDDGEPSQTAGKPMLDVLTGAGLCDTVVVVTRYFGGTLLGTGGLVRAYTAAAKAGVEASEVIEKIPAVQFLVKVTYNQIGTLLYLLGQRGYSQLDSEYAEDVSVRFLVPLTERASMEKQLLESFQGSAKTEIEDYGYYAKNGKELLLFEEEV